ncbi:hypothetical protein DYB32_005280 [Aphanomyces invadans]|uniref:Serine aminopeptidase S33 domain-containing protein n=1 Tax=Aphanomyces invadans TaxID=157072 RepID=A0A418AUW8_9STRA|nr:hypothetical protein DYB32_005280 [Aphanomyces invadans]
MTLPLFVAAAAALLVTFVVIVHLFGPGHEDAPERALVPPLEGEVTLRTTYKYESGRLQAHPVRVYTQYYYPNQTVPKGVVICLHGIYAHSGGLTPLFDDLLQRGYVVGALDFRGFGRTSGRFGYIEKFSHNVDDTLAFLETTRAKFPGQKVFVVGMTDRWLTVFRVLVKVFPKLPAIPTHGSSRANSKEVEEAVETSKQADALFYKGCLRLGTGLNMLEATLDIQTQLHKIEGPFCLIHGDSDRVCAYEGSQR